MGGSFFRTGSLLVSGCLENGLCCDSRGTSDLTGAENAFFDQVVDAGSSNTKKGTGLLDLEHQR